MICDSFHPFEAYAMKASVSAGDFIILMDETPETIAYALLAKMLR